MPFLPHLIYTWELRKMIIGIRYRSITRGCTKWSRKQQFSKRRNSNKRWDKCWLISCSNRNLSAITKLPKTKLLSMQSSRKMKKSWSTNAKRKWHTEWNFNPSTTKGMLKLCHWPRLRRQNVSRWQTILLVLKRKTKVRQSKRRKNNKTSSKSTNSTLK